MFNRNNLPNVPNPFGQRGASPAGQQPGPMPPRGPPSYNSTSGSHHGPPPQQYGAPPSQQGRAAPGSKQFGIAKVPDETWVIQNVAAANPGDFKGESYVMIDNMFVITTRYVSYLLRFSLFPWVSIDNESS